MEEIHYLLGNACNLDCDFCFWNTRTTDTSLEFKKSIIDQIVDSGIQRVTLSGGDPLTSSSFVEILEYMKEKGLDTILHTNGLLINEGLAKKITPYISRISLTMDAIDTNIQLLMRKTDKITGHTINLIKLFSNLGVDVNIKTLISQVNKNEIEQIGEILRELPIKYWALLEFTPLNRGKINEKRFYLPRAEFDDISNAIKIKFSSLEVRINKFSEKKKKYCFISANGDIYTCINNMDILVGNINMSDLKSVIKKIEYEPNISCR